MPMHFEELDDVTRHHMLAEFEREQGGDAPYNGRGLSPAGIMAFPDLMRAAIRAGNEVTLAASMTTWSYWLPRETYVLKGVSRERNVNLGQVTERLCITEFNTWYVRGLARRLLDENVDKCQAYRAAVPKWEPGECSEHEGQIFSVRAVYDGHRARYWPAPGDLAALSIPFGPGCHHTIRRFVE